MHRGENEVNVRLFSEYYNYFHRNDYAFQGHTHEKWEINVILSGEMEITHHDRILSLKKDMLLICEPGIYHRNRVLSPNGAQQLVFQFCTDSIPLCGKPRIYHLDAYGRSLVHLLLCECESDSCTGAPDCRINRQLNEPAIRLLELLLLKLTENETENRYLAAPDAVLFRQAIRYMQENLASSLTIAALASHCRTSATTLKRIFTAYTGTGVITHFSSLKMTHAKTLLGRGLSVREVSEQLGFSSQAYFSLCFKKATGIPPKDFRKNNNLK